MQPSGSAARQHLKENSPRPNSLITTLIVPPNFCRNKAEVRANTLETLRSWVEIKPQQLRVKGFQFEPEKTDPYWSNSCNQSPLQWMKAGSKQKQEGREISALKTENLLSKAVCGDNTFGYISFTRDSHTFSKRTARRDTWPKLDKSEVEQPRGKQSHPPPFSSVAYIEFYRDKTQREKMEKVSNSQKSTPRES